MVEEMKSSVERHILVILPHPDDGPLVYQEHLPSMCKTAPKSPTLV